MRNLIFVLSIIVFSFFTSAFVNTSPSKPVFTAYTIDKTHSFINFKVNRFSMVDVVGRFNEFQGTVAFDANDFSKTQAEVTIQTSSVYSGFAARENAIKSPAFLDVKKYPEIKFKSKRAYEKGGKKFVVGDFALHGVTKEITLPIEMRGPFVDPTRSKSIAIRSKITINRQDFGMKFNRKLKNGKPFIGNEIDIELNILALTK
ncbi:MAG TPA: polyisoprenoid-binding protein [Microscillaceae bacterium]|nr:polyisoprenoid-binding protein [Microscillaceae bacterium]